MPADVLSQGVLTMADGSLGCIHDSCDMQIEPTSHKPDIFCKPTQKGDYPGQILGEPLKCVMDDYASVAGGMRTNRTQNRHAGCTCNRVRTVNTHNCDLQAGQRILLARLLVTE